MPIRILFSCALIVVGVAIASFSLVQYFSLSKGSKWEKGQGPSKEVLASSNRPQQVHYTKEERPNRGEQFADLILPRLGKRVPVMEGTGDQELARGVGHVRESVLPGEPDNVVLSGHRDTVFRDLGELQKGDSIFVTTRKGTFQYIVNKFWVTDADDRTVIVPHDQAILTLTTCYPFSYIGPAPKRYIVQAILSNHKG